MVKLDVYIYQTVFLQNIIFINFTFFQVLFFEYPYFQNDENKYVFSSLSHNSVKV